MERRAPTRAVNVARLPAKAEKPAAGAKASAPEQAPVPRAKKAAGGEEDWKEF